METKRKFPTEWVQAREESPDGFVDAEFLNETRWGYLERVILKSEDGLFWEHIREQGGGEGWHWTDDEGDEMELARVEPEEYTATRWALVLP